MPPPRKRADMLLVERGLFESRARARAAIEAGFVTASGKQVLKASETIAADAEISAQPAHPWVSRGGVKLAGALEQYPIDIEGHVCLDVGASTGGFTDVLLSRGATKVYAVDVGTNQLAWKLRQDPRVVSIQTRFSLTRVVKRQSSSRAGPRFTPSVESCHPSSPRLSWRPSCMMVRIRTST